MTDLCRKSAEEGVPEVAERERKVLVEEILKELAHAEVRPAPVDEQEAFKEAELCEGVVTGQHGLHALLAADAHAYVRHYSKQHGVG